MYLFYSIFITQLSLFLYFLAKLYHINISKFSLKNFFLIIFPFCLLLTSGYRFIGYSVYDDLYLIVIIILFLTHYKDFHKNINLTDSMVIVLFSILILHTIVGLIKFNDIKLILNLFYFVGLLCIYFLLKHNKNLLINTKNIKIYFQILITYFLLLNIFAILMTFTSHISDSFYNNFSNTECGLKAYWYYSPYAHQCYQNILTSGSTLALMPVVFAFLLINFYFPKYFKHTVILNSLMIVFSSIYASETGYLYLLVFSTLVLLTSKNKIKYFYNLIISIILALFIITLVNSLFDHVFSKTQGLTVEENSIENDTDPLVSEFQKPNKNSILKIPLPKEILDLMSRTVNDEFSNFGFNLKYINQSSVVQKNDLILMSELNGTTKIPLSRLRNKYIDFEINSSFKKSFREDYKMNPGMIKILDDIDSNYSELAYYNPNILNEIQKQISIRNLNLDNPIFDKSNYFVQFIDLEKIFGIKKIYSTFSGTIHTRIKDLLILFDDKLTFTDILFGRGTKSSNYEFPYLFQHSDLNLVLFYGVQLKNSGIEYSIKKLLPTYVIHDYGKNYILMSYRMPNKQVSFDDTNSNIPYVSTILTLPKFIYDWGLIAFLIFLIILIMNIINIFKKYKTKDAIFIFFSISSVCSWTLLTDLSNNFIFYSLVFFPYILDILYIKNNINRNV